MGFPILKAVVVLLWMMAEIIPKVGVIFQSD
jgi:hypothetical protein